MSILPYPFYIPKKRNETNMFDPDGDGYDYSTANMLNLKPDPTGHWPSINPKSGLILKGKNHPTFWKTVLEEQLRGNKIVRFGGRYYSIGESL